MRQGFLSALLAAAVLAMIVPAGSFADSGAEPQAQVFTNQDLEKYRKTSDAPTWSSARNESAETRKSPQDKKRDKKKEGLKELREELDREQWCKKASKLRQLIEKAQDAVKEEENKLAADGELASGADSNKRKMRERRLDRLRKNIEKARKKVGYAEKDLRDLEDEAHRKRVPPGWLRCQFDY